jgi:hypothetical protein
MDSEPLHLTAVTFEKYISLLSGGHVARMQHSTVKSDSVDLGIVGIMNVSNMNCDWAFGKLPQNSVQTEVLLNSMKFSRKTLKHGELSLRLRNFI